MFRVFLAHPQETLYCLVSRYGKRKCALWCPVVWCGRDPIWHEKPKHVVHFLSSLHRPDEDPDKGRNIVTKAKNIYTW
jgi:hypothetical protein